MAVTIPGLNTSYGLYLEGSVDVAGTPSVYGPGTISLVLDPTDNDGTPASVWDATTQTGLVGFSNPQNTLDDVTLATGNFISGSFGTQSNGQPGVKFGETFTLNPSVFGPLLSRLSSSLDLQESLFNTSTSRVTGSTTDGGTWITSNDGYGIVSLTKASAVGDSGPTFIGPGHTGDAAAGGLSLHGLIGQEISELLARLGLNIPASSTPGGWAGLQDDQWATGAGAQYQPEPRGDWVRDLLSHGTGRV